MAPVLGGTDPAATGYAGLLGEAFQLTNFVRDVAEDWDRGRVYLPLEDLADHGVTVDDLSEAVRRGRAPRPLRELVRFECERALSLYAEAAPGLDLLDGPGRRCVRVAFVLYRMILREVAAADFDVVAARAVVPRRTRLTVATSLVLSR
jgi:phytoene synthase